MNQPTQETLKVLAEDLGMTLDADRIHQAAEAHQLLRPLLEEFRKVRLPYLDPVEPGHSRRWIERRAGQNPELDLPT